MCTLVQIGILATNQINDKREERGVTLEKIICTQNIHENTTLTVTSNK